MITKDNKRIQVGVSYVWHARRAKNLVHLQDAFTTLRLIFRPMQIITAESRPFYFFVLPTTPPLCVSPIMYVPQTITLINEIRNDKRDNHLQCCHLLFLRWVEKILVCLFEVLFFLGWLTFYFFFLQTFFFF